MQHPASRTPQPIHRSRRNPNRRTERDARRCGRRHRPPRARTVANAASGIPNPQSIHRSRRNPNRRSERDARRCGRRHRPHRARTVVDAASSIPNFPNPYIAADGIRTAVPKKTPDAAVEDTVRLALERLQMQPPASRTPNPYIAADEAVHAPHEKEPHCNGAFRKRLLQYGSLI